MDEQAAQRPRRSYVMHGAIAAGGMATVHIGRLVAHGGFARTIAIKRLHPQLVADSEVAATFAEEARLSARIAHANVAAVLDVVHDGDELLLIMEYVHGESLSRLLITARAARESVPIPVVNSILCDMLHGLHAAHEATSQDGAPLQLVHRDVSPQNVIVGVDGVARVVDFGIAKAIGRAQITREGQLRGKMPYMAPEQLLRRGIDRRTDVYAAGVIAWEALAGRRLFQADDEPTLFSKVLEDVIPPPSAHNPDVPPAFDAVVARALARNPDQRFSSAREMAVAIEEVGARASSSVVAGWVTRAAREALATRAAKIVEMERESQLQADSSSALVRAPSASVVFLEAESSRGGSRTSGTGSSPAATPLSERTNWVASPSSSRRARLGVIAGVGVLLVAAIGIAATAAARRSSEVRLAAPLPEPVAAVPESATPRPASIPAIPATGAESVAGAEVAASRPISRPKPRAQPTVQWCKVFDPDKGVYVVKSMRVTRCP
jgi:serine/threonine protein kinase